MAQSCEKSAAVGPLPEVRAVSSFMSFIALQTVLGMNAIREGELRSAESRKALGRQAALLRHKTLRPYSELLGERRARHGAAQRTLAPVQDGGVNSVHRHTMGTTQGTRHP